MCATTRSREKKGKRRGRGTGARARPTRPLFSPPLLCAFFGEGVRCECSFLSHEMRGLPRPPVRARPGVCACAPSLARRRTRAACVRAGAVGGEGESVGVAVFDVTCVTFLSVSLLSYTKHPRTRSTPHPCLTVSPAACPQRRPAPCGTFRICCWRARRERTKQMRWMA